MTADRFEREQNYRVAMALAATLLRDGVIDEAEFREIDTIMLARFRPVLSGLYPQNDLIQSERRGNM